MFATFPRLEFEDRCGVIRGLAGCSLIGRQEFFERLQQVQQRLQELPELSTVAELYDTDTRFRHYCDRCLILNGLDPDWLTMSMLEEMLFVRVVEGETRPGLLTELNQPPKSSKPTDEPATLHEILASLATHEKSLGDALKLASDLNLPANDLLEILTARSELEKSADPEYRKKKQQKAWQEKALADLTGGMPNG
ncbi:hypothetical protein [Synechococcus sp. PCC 6312]|uniref:hypothetical protein n=1 Tax=Synechococcus sp. (strain ATCC 27167 / PCC 6312) TaxID=195253 RepID=UPI00029F2DE0|nr:hypothetical protein [Synechococcus sp. PCC 6312]AFY60363.1 hypothetical protein Syn6312_1178 [Synechococcus sp. PCC 6312]